MARQADLDAASPVFAAVASIAAAAVFLGFALSNAGRSYDFDESVTVGIFVRKDTLLEAMTSQIVFGNHPLLTGLNWVVHRIGGTTETWQRLVPALAGAICVQIVCLRAALIGGLRALAVTAAAIGSFPLFLDVSRQVRGYSLMCTFALGSTLCLIHRLQENSSTRRPNGGRLYSVLVLGGLLSHLYFVVVLAGHAALVVKAPADGRRQAWLRQVLVTGAVASAIYLPMLPEFRQAAQERQGSFVPTFPLDVLEALFGTPIAAVTGALLVGALLLRSRPGRTFAVGALTLFGVIWILLQPLDLYPRFLVWGAPLAVLPIARSRSMALLGVAVAATLALSAPATLDVLRARPVIRDVADQLEAIERQGAHVCALGHVWQPLQVYTDIPPAATSRSCDTWVVSDLDLLGIDVGARSAVPLDPDGDFCLVSDVEELTEVGGVCRTRE